MKIFSPDVVDIVDIGASVSYFATDYGKMLFQKNKYHWKTFFVSLKTAGFMFRRRTSPIIFLIISSLQQNLYLEIDFVRNLGIAKDLFEIILNYI